MTAPERDLRAEHLDARAVRAVVEQVLPGSVPEKARDAAGLVRQAPAWVRRLGALAHGDRLWVLYETEPGTPMDTAGQVVIDRPRGRYLCDLFDVPAAALRVRESASAPPLVVGLLPLAGPGVLRVTRHPRAGRRKGRAAPAP